MIGKQRPTIKVNIQLVAPLTDSALPRTCSGKISDRYSQTAGLCPSQ